VVQFGIFAIVIWVAVRSSQTMVMLATNAGLRR